MRSAPRWCSLRDDARGLRLWVVAWSAWGAARFATAITRHGQRTNPVRRFIGRVGRFLLGRTRLGISLSERMVRRNYESWLATYELRFLTVSSSLYFAVLSDALGTSTSDGNSVDRYVRGYRVEITGWAGAPLAPPADVAVSAGDVVVAMVRPSKRRRDLARFFGLRSAPRSGFCVRFDLSRDDARRLREEAVGEDPDDLSRDALFTVEYDPFGVCQVLEPTETLGTAIRRPGGVQRETPPGFVDGFQVKVLFGRSRGSDFIRFAASRSPGIWIGALLDFGATQASATVERIVRVGQINPSIEEAHNAFACGDDAWAVDVLQSVEAGDVRSPDLEARVLRLRPLDERDSQRGSLGSHMSADIVEIEEPAVLNGRSAQKRWAVRAPTSGIEQVRGALVLPGGIVTSGGALVVAEPAADPRYDFIAGQWDRAFGTHGRLDSALTWTSATPIEEVDRAVLLSTRVPDNHFHFMIENLSRLASLEDHPELDGVPLIVSSRILPSGREALAACVGDRPIIWQDDDVAIRVADLIVPSMPTFHPDTTLIPWPKGSAISHRHLAYLRERLLPLAANVDSETPDLVYIARSARHARGLMNRDRIERIARDEGYAVVEPGTLSLAEQIAVFNGARVIVGTGGAAFANLVFASEGASVIALVSRQLRDFCMQANLARFAGADFQFLVGRSPGSRFSVPYHREYFHLPFRIAPRQFRRALREFAAQKRV